jgi:histidine ammonia-lyase
MSKSMLIKTSLIAFGMINAFAAPVVLDGKHMSSDKISQVAKGESIKITSEAMKRVQLSHNVLIEAAESGHKIYGLTVGVGLNKDKKMVNANGKLSQALIDASSKFNKGLIHAHCGGVGEDIPVKEARAILVTRLNNMLFGGTGVQTKVVNMYKTFLNKDIIPTMPSQGSMGEADITILGHIGLAMIGEGHVYYKGKKMPTKEAFEKAGVKKISLFGKDALSIISSNAYSGALAGLALEEMKQLTKISKYVYALSLEALNGNIAPMHTETQKLRPFPGYVGAAKKINKILEGSYLWEKDSTRALQDPLSYRDGAYILGTLDTSINKLDNLMKIQWNSSDDNPGVAIGAVSKSDRYQEKKVYVNGKDFKGAVIPTANFEPMPWVVEFEANAIVLAHNSLASAQRSNKLLKPQFTKLTRFLGTKNTVHAFGAMQKPFVSLAAKNQALANPISLNYLPVAGDIEDIATNAPEVLKRVRKQIDNLYHIYGMELLIASQAIDLRLQKNPNLKLSAETEKMYKEFRKVVDFLEYDRPLTDDFRNAAKFLKEYK